jgi:hypothetical protein
MPGPLTAANATPEQIEHHLENVVLPKIQLFEDLLRMEDGATAIETREAQRQLNHWRQVWRYFLGLYRKKGGRAMAVDLPTDYARVTPPQKREKKTREEMQRAVSQLSSRCRTQAAEIRRAVKEIHRRRQNMVDMAFSQAGGLNVGIMLVFVEAKFLRPAEKALERAQKYQSRGDLARAYANLVLCAQRLALAASAVNAYYDSLGIGAKRLEVAIALGAAIGSGIAVAGATSGYGGLTLSAADKVKLGLVEGAALNFGGLAVKRAFGEQVSQKDVGLALLETAKSGGSVWVGNWAKGAIAPKIAALRYGKPTAAQLAAVETVVEEYFKANSAIAINAFGQLAQGKKPDYDWWGGLLSPAMGIADSRLGTADKIAHDTAASEKQIADEMRKRGAGK